VCVCGGGGGIIIFLFNQSRVKDYILEAVFRYKVMQSEELLVLNGDSGK
jgi:hypothetical protein